MHISRNHHHHISPLAVAAIVIGAAMVALNHSGYLHHAFHKEILASINPAEVLTPADMAPVLPATASIGHKVATAH